MQKVGLGKGTFANLGAVLEDIDRLTGHLEDMININPGYVRNPEVIRYACRKGIKVLNEYYSMTDESVMYRVALRKQIHSKRLGMREFWLILAVIVVVLHPMFRKAGLVAAEWKEEWIEGAVDALRTTYDKFFKKEAEGESSQASSSKVRPFWCILAKNPY